MLRRTSMGQSSNEDRGMSTVVGAILVVGITVVLAAIIGGFVFGIGDDLSNTQPQVQITFDYNEEDADGDTQLQIIHDGGETITDENTGSIRLTGSAITPGASGSDAKINNDEFTIGGASDPTTVSSPVTSGQTIMSSESSADAENGVGYIVGDDGDMSNLESGDTVNVVWVSNDGSQSNQLGSFTVPE